MGNDLGYKTCYDLLNIIVYNDLDLISCYDLPHIQIDNDCDHITCFDLLYIGMGDYVDLMPYNDMSLPIWKRRRS